MHPAIYLYMIRFQSSKEFAKNCSFGHQIFRQFKGSFQKLKACFDNNNVKEIHCLHIDKLKKSLEYLKVGRQRA